MFEISLETDLKFKFLRVYKNTLTSIKKDNTFQSFSTPTYFMQWSVSSSLILQRKKLHNIHVLRKIKFYINRLNYKSFEQAVAKILVTYLEQ